MSVPKESIEAAADKLRGSGICLTPCSPNYERCTCKALIRTALTAALPHLAQPSKSDEERALEALGYTSNVPVENRSPSLVDSVAAALTAVRAEASAAEREAIAKWADTWVNAPVNIADTIRSRPTP